MKSIFHRPVLLKEVLRYWFKKKGGIYLDATIGTGGHAEALLKTDPKIKLIGLDLDPHAIQITKKRLEPFRKRVVLLNENFTYLPRILSRLKIGKIDGFLADLGLSSLQLESPERGFSFLREGPMDMRMNPTTGRTALELICQLTAQELRKLIQKFGEESRSHSIAAALKKEVSLGRLRNTLDCARIISSMIPARRIRIHPATKTFQALRIAVNNELENLQQLLQELPSLLSAGARALFIAFHSLEDRLIKNSFRIWARGCTCPPSFPQCVCGKKGSFRILTPKPIAPGAKEIQSNPRSRSAKMRVAEKI